MVLHILIVPSGMTNHHFHFNKHMELKRCFSWQFVFKQDDDVCVCEYPPEYFPPLFLLTKQAIKTMSVRRAMAHIRPINQPCVDIPWWTLARPEENKTL